MMTIWRKLDPSKNKADQLAEQIADLIKQQQLQAEQKLPPQRQLAEHLGITVGTVGRAYLLAEKHGLIYSKQGSGSYVKKTNTLWQQWWQRQKDSPQRLDMWQNCAYSQPRASKLSQQLQDYGQHSEELDALLNHDSAQSLLEHRQQLCHSLSDYGFNLHAEQLLFSYGCQHGMLLSLMALQLSNEILLCEQLCYPGLINLANQLGVKLKTVAMDEEGVTPESLSLALQRYPAKAIYLTPTLQNPTTAIMSLKRRQEIIAICRQHNIAIIEDDVCGMLPPERPPAMVNLAPDIVIHMGSFSKGIFRGLRFAYLHAPTHLLNAFNSALRASVWQVSPLLIDMACTWLSQGRAEDALTEQRRVLRQREQLLHHHFRAFDYQYKEGSLHCWLHLPSPWRCAAFVEAARGLSIEVASAEHFAANNEANPNAVRLSLGQIDDNLVLNHALETLTALLKQGPTSTDLF